MKRAHITNESLSEDLDGHEETTSEIAADIPEEQTPAAAIDAEAELEGSYKEIDDIDTGMDDAVDAQGQIAELHESVEENGESGRSMSALEESSVNVAMESIHQSLGMQWVRPTMESVSHRGRRAEMLATMESAAGHIGTKIVEGFKRAMQALMDFMYNLLRNNWVLKKYIDAMRKRVQALKGDTPTKEIMPESATAMSVDGKIDDTTIQAMYKTSMAMLKATEAAIDHVNKLNFKFAEKESDTLGGEHNPSRYLTRHTASDGGQVFGYLTNSRAFVETDAVTRVLGATSVFSHIRRYAEGAAEAPVLNKQQMLNMLDSADDIIKEIARAESKKSTIKNIISRVTQYIAGTGGVYVGLVSKAGRDYVNNYANITGIRKLLNSVISTMPLEAYKTAKAFTDYVRHSLKYYKSAEA